MDKFNIYQAAQMLLGLLLEQPEPFPQVIDPLHSMVLKDSSGAKGRRVKWSMERAAQLHRQERK